MNTVKIIDHCRDSFKKEVKSIELLNVLQWNEDSRGNFCFAGGYLDAKGATKVERLANNLPQRINGRSLDLIKVSYDDSFNLYLGFWNDGVI